MAKIATILPVKFTTDKQLIDVLGGEIVYVAESTHAEPGTVVNLSIEKDENAVANVKLHHLLLVQNNQPINRGYSHVESFVDSKGELWHAYLEDREVTSIVRDRDRMITSDDTFGPQYKIQVAMDKRWDVVMETRATSGGVFIFLSKYMSFDETIRDEFFHRLYRSSRKVQEIVVEATDSFPTLYITVEEIR